MWLGPRHRLCKKWLGGPFNGAKAAAYRVLRRFGRELKILRSTRMALNGVNGSVPQLVRGISFQVCGASHKI